MWPRASAPATRTDRIIDFTASQGGPIKKDKLWFFTSARYFSVNNFIANTFFDDGSQGIDDQFISSAHGAPDLADQPAQQVLRPTSTRSTSTAATTCRACDDPETAAVQWFSPAYHTTAVKWTSTVTSRLFLDAGFSSNLEYYTNSYRDGVEKPRGTAAWFAGASRNELDLGGAQDRGDRAVDGEPGAL